MRLTLLPTSEMAHTLKIGHIVNPQNRSEIEDNFRIYTSFKKGERVEDISDRGDGTARLNYIEKKSLSLRDGFIRWCLMAGEGDKASSVGVQWSKLTPNVRKLEDAYLKPTTNPYAKEKGGKEKWAREQDDARKVGNRLFAQFLMEGLSSENKDQQRVEIIWNQTYNAYKEPILEEVPIGFTYKKYIDNRGLFVLRQSNLNALRYFMSRGSIGLAYGVGLGKTFCSIFVMKQALDLGICERPIVIVPNQVYFQFGQEIQRGLGADFDPNVSGSRLNMFYNGMGIYNELANNGTDGINLCTYEAVKHFSFDPTIIKKEGREWLDNAMNVLDMGGDGALANPTLKKQMYKSHQSSIFNIEVDDDSSLALEDGDEFGDVVDDVDLNNGNDDLDLGDFNDGGAVSDEVQIDLEETEGITATPIVLNSPTTSYDFVVVDEAHNFNNLYSSVVASPKEAQGGDPSKKTGKIKIRREKNPYSAIRETAGGREASSRAEKLWWLSKYIQSKSPMGNTVLLSATPFTNSPLQLFTMLAYLNYEMLEEAQIGITKDFFDAFAKIEYAEDFKTDLTIIKRNKLIGWNNVIAMQKFVYRVFDKSSRADEDKAVIRPNKIVLPLKRMVINGQLYEFPKENFVSTTIKLSNLQSELWNKVRRYAGGKKDASGNIFTYEELCSEDWQNETKLGKYRSTKKSTGGDEDGSAEIDITDGNALNDGTKEGEKASAGAKALQCLMWGRQICLNPYLFKCSGFKTNPTGKEYVEASPKLLYVMECIKSIKEYHENSKTSPYMSGQVIYMNFGVQAFPLIREYLVKELGFNLKEIGIIAGSGNYIGKKRFANKQMVADAFLGRKRNEETGDYVAIPNSDRVKVLIGSEAIKEGINLQNYASVLYNCFLDFNPTDQVQVEGRIWRQGNEFANVRIVTPLMSDCIDVFMFQKLEDKTERINQIWTKSGNANELDTTAFNPAELKYELLSDPEAIAKLEVEYKKEILEEKITEESELLSNYVGLQSIYEQGEKIKFPKVSRATSDFRLNMYYAISLIRPDLIEKPLWSKEEFEKMLDIVVKSEDFKKSDDFKSGKALLEIVGSPFEWGYDSRRYMKYSSSNPFNWETLAEPLNPIYLDWVSRIFNYSAEELIDLMTRVMKEQKIAYPRGYSKNWRDLLPKRQLPIIEGDMVEYDTKKGRKKGKAEFVLADDGDRIINWWLKTGLMNSLDNEDDNLKLLLKESGFDKQKEQVKKLLVSMEEGDDAVDEQLKDEKYLSFAISLFKWVVSNLDKDYIDSRSYVNDDDSWSNTYTPHTLDIGDLEELSIEDKNISKVLSKEEKADMPKPTKYPDPFVYSNKDLFENLKEIYEYGMKVLKNKDYKNVPIESARDVNEQQLIQFNYDWKDLLSTLRGSYSMYTGDWDSSATNTLPKTWTDLEARLSDVNNYSLWTTYGGGNFYNFHIARDLAEFRTTQKRRFEPMGITKLSQIDELITNTKQTIGGYEVEQQNLNNKEVFEEIVQEVIRTQEELNSEEIRAGSSYVARAENFANSNPDYLGNKLLDIFNHTPQEMLTDIQTQYRPSSRAIEEALKSTATAMVDREEEAEDSGKEGIETLINQLKPALEFLSGKEKTELNSLVKSLESALEFM
jgi:hypothetical protein